MGRGLWSCAWSRSGWELDWMGHGLDLEGYLEDILEGGAGTCCSRGGA